MIFNIFQIFSAIGSAARRLILACLLLISGQAMADAGVDAQVHANTEKTRPQILTLPQYVRLALQQSDVAQDIKDSVLLSDLDLEAAQSEYDFRFVPVANLGVTNGSGTQTAGLEVRKKTQFGPSITLGARADKVQSDQFDIINSHRANAYVRLSTGLFRSWGKKYNRLDLTLSEYDRQREQILAEKKLRDMLSEAINTYYQALLDERLLEKSRQALARNKAHLEAAQARLKAGLVSNADLHRAELAMLTAENDVQGRERSLDRSREQFHEMLAEDDVTRYQPDPELAELRPVYPQDWKNKALAFRADWRAQDIEKQKADLTTFRAERGILPDVTLSLSYEERGLGDSFDSAARLTDSDQAVLLQLNSDVNLKAKKAAIQRERTHLKQLERNRKKLKRQIYREIRDAAQDLESQKTRRAIAAKREQAARQAVEAAQIRYERGLDDNLAVLDAEEALSNALLDRDRSLVAYNNAAVHLAQSMGVLNMDWLMLAGAGADATVSEPEHEAERRQSEAGEATEK